MASSTPEKTSRTGSIKIFESGAWLFGKLLSRKTRTYSESEGGETTEEHEVYEATRIDPPSETPDIIKIKRQTKPWSDRNYREPSDEVFREIHNLSRLSGFSSTPELIDKSIETQGCYDGLPDGYIAYIIMQKVPGKGLAIFDTLTPGDQNRVRIAFINALWAFRSNYFRHWDPRRENLIWNFEKNECYIIDLEDAEQDVDLKKSDVCLDPEEELENWGLGGGRPAGTLYYEKEELMDYMEKNYPVVD